MSHAIIKAENGNDFVSIAGDGTGNIIYLKEGDDSVVSSGSNSTINVGIGKNLVTLNANSSGNSIIAGNGDDSVLINDSGGEIKSHLVQATTLSRAQTVGKVFSRAMVTTKSQSAAVM